MEPVEYLQKQRTARFLTAIFSIVVIFSYIWLREKSSLVAKWMPLAMLILGTPTFIGASILFGRYRKVYDYEQASFLGRQMLAIQIRGTLGTISLIGGWLIFGGISLYVIGYF